MSTAKRSALAEFLRIMGEPEPRPSNDEQHARSLYGIMAIAPDPGAPPAFGRLLDAVSALIDAREYAIASSILLLMGSYHRDKCRKMRDQLMRLFDRMVKEPAP